MLNGLVQRRLKPDRAPSSRLRQGLELKDIVEATGADTVIVDSSWPLPAPCPRGYLVR